MEFKNFELSDIEILAPLILNKKSPSCENTLLNLAVWAPSYNPQFCIDGNDVYIMIDDKNGPVFSLMLCAEIEKSVNKICEYCKKENIIPQLLIEDDETFVAFNKKFGGEFFIYEVRDAAEYIYKQSELSTLSGKKFHSKRNHISAFTRKYNWVYEELCDDNKSDFLKMSNAWYRENPEKINGDTLVEQNGIHYLVENMSKFNLSGGLIRVDDKVVAITLGAPINENVFDVMIEKALADYPGAYTVINNEFAKRIKTEFINREEDLGILGLRKAKLSYQPYHLLRKYIAVPLSIYNSSKQLHIETFEGESEASATELLNSFFKDCLFVQKDGRVISQLFVIGAELGGKSVGYIYAAATDKAHRSRGLMSGLIETAKSYYETLALRPAEESLYDYYKKLGFGNAFYSKQILEINTDEAVEIKKITELGEFLEIRNSLLPQNSLNLCADALEYILNQYEVYTEKDEFGRNLAVFYIDNGRLFIRELLSNGKRDEFVSAILNEFNCNEFSALTYCDEKKNPTGMIYPPNEEINYLGLAID